jgi:hypothetical protein
MPNVSKKHNVCTFRAKEYSGKLAQLSPASAGFLLGLLVNTKDEAVCSFETLGSLQLDLLQPRRLYYFQYNSNPTSEYWEWIQFLKYCVHQVHLRQ